MTDVCDDCGREFKNIGSHLWQTNCSYPEISGYKMEVLRGMLMGDASLYRQSKLPYFQVRMVNKEFLEHLDTLFSTLSRGISFERSAKESKKALSEISPNTNAKNCSDLYLWRTMAHVKFNTFRSWYSSGEKQFPHIDMSPTVLKYWYVCDGSLDSKYGSYIRISAYNERSNKEKLFSLFDSTPIEPSRISKNGAISFNKENSIEMLDWMGEPLPGFKYKWNI